MKPFSQGSTGGDGFTTWESKPKKTLTSNSGNSKSNIRERKRKFLGMEKEETAV